MNELGSGVVTKTPAALRVWPNAPDASVCSDCGDPATTLSLLCVIGLSMQPASAKSAAPATRIMLRILVAARALEVGVEREEDGAARRERCHVLEAADRAVAEVRDLGVVARVPRPRLQVAATELEAGVLRR